VATWNPGNHLSIRSSAQWNQQKPVSRWSVAGPSEYWLLASSPSSKVKKKQCPHSTTNTHKTTTHTRQLQQYTRPTNNNYIKDNLKLATKHTRQIRILQHVKKVKTPKQESTVYSFLYFLQSLIHSRFHPSLSLLITYYSYKTCPWRLVPPPLPNTALHFTSFHFTLFRSLHNIYLI